MVLLKRPGIYFGRGHWTQFSRYYEAIGRLGSSGFKLRLTETETSTNKNRFELNMP